MELELLYVQPHGDDQLLLAVNVTKDGETVRTAYIFPSDTMEWRASEYGIDPSDTDTLLDILLYEPHIQVDPALQLYMAPDVDSAREHILARVEEKKAETGQERGQARMENGKDVRAEILSLCHLDPEAISLKTRIVEHQRVASARSVPRKALPVDRLALLRETLKGIEDAVSDLDHPSFTRKA